MLDDALHLFTECEQHKGEREVLMEKLGSVQQGFKQHHGALVDKGMQLRELVVVCIYIPMYIPKMINVSYPISRW